MKTKFPAATDNRRGFQKSVVMMAGSQGIFESVTPELPRDAMQDLPDEQVVSCFNPRETVNPKIDEE